MNATAQEQRPEAQGHGPKYFLDIEGTIHEWDKDTITTEEIIRLTELCAAYAKPYLDLASDIIPGDRPAYGGRVCIAWDGNGCLACLGALDLKDARVQLTGPEAQRDEDAIYGVERRLLGQVGPSVVSINGAIASIAVTEFVAGVTGLRRPFRLLNYYGHLGRMTTNQDEPESDCYYCKSVWGLGSQGQAERYIEAGVGRWLR